MAVEIDTFNQRLSLRFNVEVQALDVHKEKAITIFSNTNAVVLQWQRFISEGSSKVIEFSYPSTVASFLTRHFNDWSPIFVDLPDGLLELSVLSGVVSGTFPATFPCL